MSRQISCITCKKSRHGPAQLFKTATLGLDDDLGDLGGALAAVVNYAR